MFIRYLITGILILEVLLIIEARNLYYKIRTTDLTYSLETDLLGTAIEKISNLQED